MNEAQQSVALGLAAAEASLNDGAETREKLIHQINEAKGILERYRAGQQKRLQVLQDLKEGRIDAREGLLRWISGAVEENASAVQNQVDYVKMLTDNLGDMDRHLEEQHEYVRRQKDLMRKAGILP